MNALEEYSYNQLAKEVKCLREQLHAALGKVNRMEDTVSNCIVCNELLTRKIEDMYKLFANSSENK